MPTVGAALRYQEETVVEAAARGASGDTGTLPGFGPASTLRIQLDCGAGTGTSPSLTVTIEDTLDGTNWNAVHTFTAVTTGASRQVANITAPFADRLRVRWTITGTTPSFTFSVIVASQSPLS